jgi:hypothetical protein
MACHSSGVEQGGESPRRSPVVCWHRGERSSRERSSVWADLGCLVPRSEVGVGRRFAALLVPLDGLECVAVRQSPQAVSQSPLGLAGPFHLARQRLPRDAVTFD